MNDRYLFHLSRYDLQFSRYGRIKGNLLIVYYFYSRCLFGSSSLPTYPKLQTDAVPKNTRFLEKSRSLGREPIHNFCPVLSAINNKTYISATS